MHGFSYDCWEGHPTLPRLNLGEPAVREHIFDVARFWLNEVGIDGWRLDVAHEISPDFWREFRTVCVEANPAGGVMRISTRPTLNRRSESEVCMSIHPKGKLRSDICLVLVLNDSCARSACWWVR